jgi:hypothetical protein
MAEVLGIIASVAQIASQLLACVETLRSFSRAVCDLPEDLSRILKEVEMLGKTLNQLDALNKRSFSTRSSSLLEESLEHCSAIAATLEVLATRANASFKEGNFKKRQRPWKYIRAVWKKDEIEKLKNRLESATSLLHLVITCHSLYANIPVR